MELELFISEVITDIVLGIQHAKIQTKDFVAIAPGRLDGERLNEKTDIEFDISLTVEESQKSQTKGAIELAPSIKVVGINLGSIKRNLNKENSQTNGSTHRIKFKVPIMLSSNFRADPNFVEIEAKFYKEASQGRKKPAASL